MSRQIIAVDIDNTVVNTGILWNQSLLSRFKQVKWVKGLKQPYNLTELFELPDGTDGFDFWRDPSLYNGLQPLEHSVEALTKLSEQHDIIFVSQAKGWHHKSKFKFVEKWFPFNKGLVLTKEKFLVRCDVLVDDSLTQLNSMPEDVKCLWFQTDYIQSGVTPNKHMYNVNNWKDVDEKFIKELLC